jgi:hypothetical protein
VTGGLIFTSYDQGRHAGLGDPDGQGLVGCGHLKTTPVASSGAWPGIKKAPAKAGAFSSARRVKRMSHPMVMFLELQAYCGWPKYPM